MVATRNHPQDFVDEPGVDLPINKSPTKRAPTARASTSAKASSLEPLTDVRTKRVWQHTPSNLTLIWLAISLPLVVWDTGYVLLRPYSMPGGSLHYPIWSPYELYGRIDHVYGIVSWEAGNGWTAAQGLVNAFETTAYFVYLYLVYMYGEQEPKQGRGAPDRSIMGQFRALGESRTLHGRLAAIAVLIAYSTATITFWKTVLYWLIEVFSGFHSIGHNDLYTIILLWVLPNGPWLVLPLYMMYVFGAEILQGLDHATGGEDKKLE